MKLINNIKFEDKNIFLIVPGFKSLYKKDFAGDLNNIFIKNKKNVVALKYLEYNKESKKMPTLDSLIEKFNIFYYEIKNNYPEKKITIIAHSQGAFIVLKFLSENFNKNIDVILIAPAVFLEEIILNKITSEQKEKINNDEKINFYLENNFSDFKIIDKKWLESYQKISIIDNLEKIKNKIFIIKALNDKIVKNKNIDILLKKIENKKLIEINSDHAFWEPKSALVDLEKEILEIVD